MAMITKIYQIEDSRGLSMGDEFAPCDKAANAHPPLFEPHFLHPSSGI